MFGLFQSILVIFIFDDKIFPLLVSKNHSELAPSDTTIDLGQLLCFSVWQDGSAYLIIFLTSALESSISPRLPGSWEAQPGATRLIASGLVLLREIFSGQI